MEVTPQLFTLCMYVFPQVWRKRTQAIPEIKQDPGIVCMSTSHRPECPDKRVSTGYLFLLGLLVLFPQVLLGIALIILNDTGWPSLLCAVPVYGKVVVACIKELAKHQLVSESSSVRQMTLSIAFSTVPYRWQHCLGNVPKLQPVQSHCSQRS